MTDEGTESTPEPEGPPQRRTRQLDENIWQDDDGSLPSLPPLPSPLDYSASTNTPLGGVFVMSSDDTASIFSDKSMEDRLHRTLNRNVEHRYNNTRLLEPTLEVARLVQQVDLLRETNAELRHENKLLLAGGQALEAQREGLVEARTTAELRAREACQESAGLQQELNKSQAQVKLKDEEIQALKAQLEQVLTDAKKEQDSAVEKACQEAKREISELRKQNASLEQEKKDTARVLEETQTLLEKATEECAARKPTKDSSVQTDALPVQSPRDCASTSNADGRMDMEYLEALVSMTATTNQKASPRHYSNDEDSLPIGERLCRIRDATERASLVKEHAREISRLTAKHEGETKELLSKFEKEKDALLEEAMSEMNAGYKGLRRRLELEHTQKMEKVERQHRKEMERLRQEADTAAAAAAESLEVAMAQVTSANERCHRETKRREALEIRLDQLQMDFDAQKKELVNKHAVNLSKLGHGWEAERKSLVDTLQRECNSVFDRTKSASPRSVTTDFFADIELAEKHHTTLSPLGEQQEATEVRSPTFSELDRTLRETEALVDKVLGSNVDG